MSVEYYLINVVMFFEKKSGMEWGINFIRSYLYENWFFVMCIFEVYVNMWLNILLDFNIYLLIFICKYG